MIKKYTLILCCTLFITSQMMAQNTVGLLSYDPGQTYDGYNLIYPHNQPNVYLLDNCGEIVHVWTDSINFRPGNTAYLLEDGRMVKTTRPASIAGDAIWAGGGGATVEIRDWDNNLEWSFTLNDEKNRLHHDIEPMPNGNILMIVWEAKTRDEAIQAGRDSTKLANDVLWPDYIIEVDPSTDEIVWEWHLWDHLIQDFDETKDNFGVVADHPEWVDINFDTDGAADWIHGNSIDYNAEIDQILFSTPFLNEIWIIDHSTTTEQAAGHVGGFGGRGGDLLYRWGNPQSYRAGTADDQQLFNNHDAHWIGDFLPPSHPDFGKILIFNNQAGPDFSTVNVINQPWDMYTTSYPMPNATWEPTNFDATITHPTPTDLYSTGLSSAQFLPNGNTLICSGRLGYSFELTPANEIVWEYRTPLIGGQPATQGDSLNINNNLTFRMDRYPTDYTAFDGRDLSQKGWIENDPNEFLCDQILPTSDIMEQYNLKIFPNPAADNLVIEWQAGVYVEVDIFDLLGRKMHGFRATGGRRYLDVSNWESGIYFVEIGETETRKLLIAR
ncbi:MAG: aryl-sulfate sulfotransferase [Bacteroidota bacterium]